MPYDDAAAAAARQFFGQTPACYTLTATEFMSTVTQPLIPIAFLKHSKECRDVVTHFEQGPQGGHAAHPYFCSAGACTVGYGHVVKPGESFIYPMSRAFAETLMDNDLARFDREVRQLLTKLGVTHLTQGQFDALVSMAFNLGTGTRDGRKGDLADSDLINYVAAGRMIKAAEEIPKWKFAGGKILGGLIRRRRCELYLFTTGKVDYFLSKAR